MSVENKQVRGDASVSCNASMGGNARVQGSVHIGHNLRVDGWIEGKNIKAANKGLFISESELNRAYPNPQDGWFAGVGETSPFTVYIANGGVWQRTNGTFAVDVDMSRYNGRIDELESQLESNNALIAELIEIIREGGGGADLVMITIENDNPTWGSVSGGGLKRKGSVTVTATAENGYHFVKWQDAEGNTIAGAGATYTFEATESVTLKAVFAVSYFTVTVGTDQTTLGDVSKSPSEATDGYIYNEEVTLTATPKQTVATAYFVRWENAQGVVKSTSASYTFNITENVTLKAVFAEVAVIDRGIDSGSTGTGTITATVTRGGVDVAETDVRIGDHVLITLTGTSKKPSSLTVGGIEVQCTPAQDGKVWTYEFDYSGSESLTFRATFDGEAIVAKKTVSVRAKEASWGTVKILVGGIEKESPASVNPGTTVTLVATANDGFAFDHWEESENRVGEEASWSVAINDDVAYTAVFKQVPPDWYYGVFNAEEGETVADNPGMESGLTPAYLTDGDSSQFNMITGTTFIVLYDASKVTPTSWVVDKGTQFEDRGSNFDEGIDWKTGTYEHSNGETYNWFQYNGVSQGANNMLCEITFAAVAP